MKVNIRSYSPVLLDVRKWESKYERMREKQLGLDRWDFDEPHYNRIDSAVMKIFDVLHSRVRKINSFWQKLIPQKYDVKVEYADIWDASITLGHVITPVLKELKKHKHGSPFVHPEDVPEHLRPTEEPGPDNGYTDNTVHERWSWVLDEMIWAFEQATRDWEMDYIHNLDQLDMYFVPVEDDEGKKKGYSEIKFNDQKDPTKPAYHRDQDGIEAHRKRMENGRRLFAKYYDGLWD